MTKETKMKYKTFEEFEHAVERAIEKEGGTLHSRQLLGLMKVLYGELAEEPLHGYCEESHRRETQEVKDYSEKPVKSYHLYVKRMGEWGLLDHFDAVSNDEAELIARRIADNNKYKDFACFAIGNMPGWLYNAIKKKIRDSDG